MSTYQVNFAARGNAEETLAKKFRHADSALRLGKCILSNQKEAHVTVYEVGNPSPVRYAKKSGWKWQNFEA